ncbi:MAG: MCE family protein [Paludibacteraceae bacterium]|nr:MCE family protein [Paludibacteraceae bacterium]
MKISREVRVGLLAALCLFLLYFGFKFLKGTNIFNPIHSYSGRFVDLQGLTEQAPVYVRGFKVGQVEEITYDFAQDTAFNIVVSLNKDIRVVEGSELRLVPDGLLGGMAVEVIIPAGQELAEIPAHSQLPTSVKPSMIDGLAGPIIASLDSTLSSIRALVDNVNGQIEKDQLRTILAHADELLTSLKATSSRLDGILKNDVPHIMQEVDGILTDVKKLSANASEADIAALVARADATLAEVNRLVEAANNPNGTTGKLLHDESLYNNLNSTLQSADSLMQDLREQPNSVIWGKKKKKK